VHGKVEIAAVHQYRAVPERVAFGIRRREVGDHCRLLRDCRFVAAEPLAQ